MFLELAQIFGYISNGLTRRYFAAGRHWFDLVVVVVTGTVICSLSEMSAMQETWFNTTLGVLVFCKWSRFLVYLRQIRSIGIQILPIMQTMWDIIPFLLVFTLYMLATINMFYALKTGWDLEKCAELIYRLVVLGDADLKELETPNPGPGERVDLKTGVVHPIDWRPTDNYVVVR